MFNFLTLIICSDVMILSINTFSDTHLKRLVLVYTISMYAPRIIILNGFHEVSHFTPTCAEMGEWNGEPIAEFIILSTQVTDPFIHEGKRHSLVSIQIPFFFFLKVQFDQLDESRFAGVYQDNFVKSKMKRDETKLYLKCAIEEIRKNRASLKECTKGEG